MRRGESHRTTRFKQELLGGEFRRANGVAILDVAAHDVGKLDIPCIYGLRRGQFASLERLQASQRAVESRCPGTLHRVSAPDRRRPRDAGHGCDAKRQPQPPARPPAPRELRQRPARRAQRVDNGPLGQHGFDLEGKLVGDQFARRGIAGTFVHIFDAQSRYALPTARRASQGIVLSRHHAAIGTGRQARREIEDGKPAQRFPEVGHLDTHARFGLDRQRQLQRIAEPRRCRRQGDGRRDRALAGHARQCGLGLGLRRNVDGCRRLARGEQQERRQDGGAQRQRRILFSRMRKKASNGSTTEPVASILTTSIPDPLKRRCNASVRASAS